MRESFTTAVLAGATIILTMAIGASPAAATGDIPAPGTGGTTTSDGYNIHARLDLSGDHRGSSRRTISIPATCWWNPVPGDYSNPRAILADYDSLALQSALVATYGGMIWEGSPTVDSVLRDARDQFVEAAKSTEKIGWYVAVCRSSTDPITYYKYAANGNCPAGMVLQTFPLGEPRAPQVTSADIALVAKEYLDLPVPTIERNPKIAAEADATIVNFPTWFWVTDDDSVGGAKGTRHLHAAVGDVSADLTATTDGLTITSPAGDTTCTPEQAMTEWSGSAKESEACTLSFTRASVAYPGGYPVRTSATWQAAWTGSDGDGGILDDVERTATTAVPVAEIQTIVTR